MMNGPVYETYVKHFALSNQFRLLVFRHVLKFLLINLLAVFLINTLISPSQKKNKQKIMIIIIILIINVLKRL